RKAQNLLPIYHPLNGVDTILRRDKTSQVDDAANVVRHVSGERRRCFPQFTLRKSERMKARFAALKPLFETSAFILRHVELPRAEDFYHRRAAGQYRRRKVRRDRLRPRYRMRRILVSASKL